MTIQAGQNVTVTYKKQSGLGTPASGSGGTIMRINEGSQGMTPTRQSIENAEARRDGQKSRGRLGMVKANGSYIENLAIGTQMDRLEAMLRSTATATFQVLPADVTSITTTTGAIVGASGSFLTKNIRRGDKVKLTNHSTVANNGKWLRVIDVDATHIFVPTGALVLDASPDTTFSIDVAKSLISGATPTEMYWTIDEYDTDLDLSTLITDAKVCKMELAITPTGNVTITFTWMALGVVAKDNANSPVLITGTATTAGPLVMADGTIRINGVDYPLITGFTLTADCGGSIPDVCSMTGPDVVLNNMSLSGSFTALKTDLAFLAAHLAETTVDFFIDCVENDATDPKDFISFYIGNAVLGGPSSPLGNTGPRVITVPWSAGKDEAGTSHAATMLKISSSV